MEEENSLLETFVKNYAEKSTSTRPLILNENCFMYFSSSRVHYKRGGVCFQRGKFSKSCKVENVLQGT